MRLIQQNKHKETTIEVAWMWLPTFIGQNSALLKELDLALTDEFPPPIRATEKNLDEMHQFVANWLSDRLQISGLLEYLLSIHYVSER